MTFSPVGNILCSGTLQCINPYFIVLNNSDNSASFISISNNAVETTLSVTASPDRIAYGNRYACICSNSNVTVTLINVLSKYSTSITLPVTLYQGYYIATPTRIYDVCYNSDAREFVLSVKYVLTNPIHNGFYANANSIVTISNVTDISFQSTIVVTQLNSVHYSLSSGNGLIVITPDGLNAEYTQRVYSTSGYSAVTTCSLSPVDQTCGCAYGTTTFATRGNNSGIGNYVAVMNASTYAVTTIKVSDDQIGPNSFCSYGNGYYCMPNTNSNSAFFLKESDNSYLIKTVGTSSGGESGATGCAYGNGTYCISNAGDNSVYMYDNSFNQFKQISVGNNPRGIAYASW